MDKINNSQYFSAAKVNITVANGEISHCSDGKKTVSRYDEQFYEVLMRAMNKLASERPQEFKKMYYTLYFSTREYKIAGKIYKKLRGKKYDT